MKLIAKEQLLSQLSGAHTREEMILATVSGVVTTNGDMIRYVDEQLPAITLITTKSFQVHPNEGNREPILTEPEPGCYGNSVGLRNPGMAAASKELERLRKQYPLRSWLNVSLSGSTPEEFITLARAFEATADLLELNFSCPHAASGYGSQIGGSWETASSFMEQIRSELGEDFSVPIFPKLTPNTRELGRIARAVMDAGADGLAAINTVGPERFIEAKSRQPILQNPLGGKGGKSGRWIRKRALEALGEIRSAVGEYPVILGMGGVSTGRDAADMVRAGADTVGIGSAFGKVRQRYWRSYTDQVKQEGAEFLGKSAGREIAPEESSSSYLSKRREMEYRSTHVDSVEAYSDEISIITLRECLPYEAGQFVFLWLPGVGEKPFSPALAEPLTFIVKKLGPFSRALCSLKAGDRIFFRGVYGEGISPCSERRAVLVAGGTGIAVLPALAKRLCEAGKECVIFYGTKDDQVQQAPFQEELETFGPVTVVPDQGMPARVLYSALMDVRHSAVYVVGPDPFMGKAAGMATTAGVPAESIFLSLEQPTLCGVGLCGACSCSGYLTCQYGTFMPLALAEGKWKEGKEDP